jgi:hypothetical protein
MPLPQRPFADFNSATTADVNLLHPYPVALLESVRQTTQLPLRKGAAGRSLPRFCFVFCFSFFPMLSRLLGGNISLR